MKEPTKIDFFYRRKISDFTELMEILFPDNRNQQYAAACIFFELKDAHHIVPNSGFIEQKYNFSRRILQRARAKLSRLGLIEHVSSFNTRYGGQQGWKLSSRFEIALIHLAHKCEELRTDKSTSREKDQLLLRLADARRTAVRTCEPQHLNT